MIGTALMTILAVTSGGGDETGALRGWTSHDPVVVQSRALVADGRWSDAERLLSENARDGDPALADRLEMAEIIRRLRYDYRLEEADLLARINRQLPDVTSADLHRWRTAGQVRFRMVDGQIRYFRSEPGNLYRFCPEAKRRLEEKAPDATPAAGNARDASRLVKHLAEVIAAAEKTGQAEVVPVRHRVRYTLKILPDRPGARAGSLVRCWLPFPQAYRQQKDVKLIRTSPEHHKIAPNALGDPADARTPAGGSDFTGAPQRTVYLEQHITDPTRELVFEEEFEYTSYAYYPKISDEDARPLPPGFDGTYLGERPPHIVFTPEIKALTEQIVGGETNPLMKARKIFNHLDQTVFWGPEEEYSVIPSFCIQALKRGQGDCGLQSTLFITMCRFAGVPARWQSGFQTKPWSWNMHDWSEIYVDPWGWLPVDMSFGRQPSDDPRVRGFYLGHQDSYRMIVSLDYGRQLVPPKNSPRSEPADFQRGEVEIDGRNLYFDEWDTDVKIEWQPG